jgi:GNAT superfamily N-acetyltransferase
VFTAIRLMPLQEQTRRLPFPGVPVPVEITPRHVKTTQATMLVRSCRRSRIVPTLLIRAATRADIPDLLAWNAAMAWETEHKTLDAAVLERGITGVFEQPQRGFYLVAERDGAAVGCLLVTYEWSDWRNGNFWWIQSVYVVAAARRSGVFRALHAEVAQRARSAGAIGLRLYVETENQRAQQTYTDLGMERCHYFMYEASLL